MKDFYKLHPFFDDPKPSQRLCDYTGCPNYGEYRAPVSPGRLNEYYWFCLDHVKEYNLNWDFYKRMSQEEIERSYREDASWQRPSWKFGQGPRTQNIHPNTQDSFNIFTTWSDDYKNINNTKSYNKTIFFNPTLEESKALKILGLSANVDPEIFKKRYRELVKKYHPDLNRGCNHSEELLKKINQAYSLLKKYFL